MAILLNNNGYENTDWYLQLSQQLPEIPIQIYPKITEPESIQYAAVWDHPIGDLQRYKNLRAIFSLGAGMEHLLDDESLPEVPLIPLLDPVVAEDMANYALYWVMNCHRQYDEYRHLQSNKIWQAIPIKPSSEFKVTVIGLGRIGKKLVETILGSGYQVKGWDFKLKTLTQKFTENVYIHAGISELYSSIRDADVVINCLPINAKTKGLINADFLSQMPAESTLINISRGAVIDEQDLLNALNHNAIKAAVLDVFSAEPLPAEHELWQHPKVTITPHISGATYARSGASVIVNNIKRMENGEMPEGVFDRNRGLSND